MSAAPLRVLVVHSSAEFYGSDKSLLDVVRMRPPHMAMTVVLPEQGPLVAALQACGAEVLVGEVCKLQRAMLSPAGLWRTLRAVLDTLRFLGSLHRKRQFQLVYSNSVAILGGALFARRAGLPHVWHVREIVASSRQLTWVFRQLVRRMCVRAVCNSAETRAWIADGGPAQAARYLVVWNGMDPSGAPLDRAAARRSLGAAPNELLFVLVGRLNAWKGHGLLVEAFAALVRQDAAILPPLRLAIVGSSYAGQEHFEAQLRDAVAGSGCAAQITVAPFRDDVEAVWVAADVVVVPSTEPEPFGRVAVEAMGFAKPVIAAAHGGLIEIVQDGITGLLVPPRDAAALAGALKRIAVDGPLREAMGLAGRERQRTLFSLQGYVERVTAVLQEAAVPAAFKRESR